MSLVFAAPASLEDLDRLLAGPAPCWLIAGGTDRLIAPGRAPDCGVIVDLTRIAALRRIALSPGMLHLGAGVTVARLAADPEVMRWAPVLAQAADVFGSVQIRNRATLGGNVANGAAAADLMPALLAAEAQVHLRRAGTPLVLPLADLLARGTGLHKVEVITGFDLPLPPAPPPGAFVKLGPRQEPAISRLTLAAAGPAGAMRLFAGAIGPIPRRMPAAEACLNAGGTGLADALADEVRAANPGRASTDWKARAARALAQELLARLEGAAA